MIGGGSRLENWKPDLRRFVEYRDPGAFDRLCAALGAAGLD